MHEHTLIDYYGSIEKLVQCLNEQPAWLRHHLAGRHAFEEAMFNYRSDHELREDYDSRGDAGDSIFQAPLDVLRKIGCKLTGSEPLEWAKRYADVPHDLDGII